MLSVPCSFMQKPLYSVYVPAVRWVVSCGLVVYRPKNQAMWDFRLSSVPLATGGLPWGHARDSEGEAVTANFSDNHTVVYTHWR